MMNKIKSKITKRLFAGIMALLMLLSLLPMPVITHAAIEDAITITVVDEEGSPVEGASVTIVIDSASDETKDNTKDVTTDADGMVEVMQNSDFVENDFTISATVTKEGYDIYTLEETPLTEVDQNIDITLSSSEVTKIEGVTIQGQTLTYNGGPQNAVVVTGTQAEDTVTYFLDGGDASGEVPQVTEVGTYSITVTVARDGYETLEEIVTTTVNKADITDVNIEANELAYNGEEQELITLSGDFLETDTVTWEVGEEETGSSDIPKASAVGNYTVKLTVDRGANYNVFEKEVEVTIAPGTFEVEGITVNGLDLTYTGEEQAAIKVTREDGVSLDYELYYQLDEDGDETTIDEDSWSTEIPKVTDAGSYIVWVKAVKENYEDVDISVTPATEAVAPYNVCVKKAKQEIQFVNETYKEGNSASDVKGLTPFENQKFDFSAEIVKGVGTISYELVLEENATDIASINGSEVTVVYPGVITVKAKLAGDDNHEETSAEHKLTVKAVPESAGTYVKFNNEVEYIFGENAGVVSEQTASKENEKDDAAISYSIDKTDIGLSCDGTNGKVAITDYAKLADALIKANGNLEVTITANKAETDFYGADSATYKITISFMETPTDAIVIDGIKGEINDNETGWYVSAITVIPSDVEGYSISSVCASGSFGESVEFDNQGTDTRYVYLCHKETGGITNRIVIEEKIDTVAPDTNNMKIEFSELTFIEKIGAALGFYKPNTTVTFTAEDVTSGVHHFNWSYTKETDASASNLEDKSGTLVATTENGVATAELTLPLEEAEHMRGKIAFSAVDNAGNESNKKIDDKVFVIDKKNPECVVMYAGAEPYVNAIQTIGEKHYFDGAVEVAFTITEVNFYEEIVTVSVNGNAVESNTISWTDGNKADEHVGTFILEEDGEYIITITAMDKSENPMTDYMSETIVIDDTKPSIDFSFDENSQKATIIVEEQNFRASDIEVAANSVTDFTGNDITDKEKVVEAIENYIKTESNWEETQEGMHRLVLESGENALLADAIYSLKFTYKDLAFNEIEEPEVTDFIVDHKSPENVEISYSTPLFEAVLEAVTFGYYKANVEVTFTAYDATSGVEFFEWNYTKENDASDVNRDTDIESTVVSATPVKDKEGKITHYTATVVLPNTEAEQLRGNLAVVAGDVYSNKSEKVTDTNRVIVVDSIAPTMEVEYSIADGTAENVSYYKGDVEVTFNVTEANFYKEDVKINISKDSGTPYEITPQWTDESADKHVGKYVLSGDGDYVITVTYKDRSTNEMAEYTSDLISIDTVKPVINVKYDNTNVINTLADKDGNQRKYFAAEQVATITITDNNINMDDVVLDIKAADVVGNALDVNKLCTVSEWTHEENSDVYVATINYPGDANYTFDISCTDLAKNPSVDYETDYFTVDNTAPVDLKVSYSTSVLETILEVITFGFYNAKADVTIVADDAVSGVQNFAYSYLKADGVSDVNAELINEAISSANIVYSNGGKTATTSFQISKETLTSNNQFNGNVSLDAVDRAGWKSTLSDNKRIVVDNIAPTAQVTYNEPVKKENGISYYNGNVDATVVITEANFYASDVSVMVSKDGGAAYAVAPSWTDSNVNLHTGTFTVTGDGDYVVTISYRDKSSNEMVAYTSEQLTIDTDIQEPTITFNGNNETGHAYKGEIVPQINFSDINYDSYEVFLYRTYMNEIDVDITASKNVNALFTISEESGSATLNIFDTDADGNYDQNDDGIYRLVVTMNDKAGHTIEKEAYFTINRYGSVYAFDEYLVELIADGGAYVNEITGDLIITEYNADQLVSDSLSIEITRDGKPLEDAKYTVSPAINENVAVGDSGWYQYEYVISKDNFVIDGIYKISISSKDATGNTPENSNYEDKNILFRVDSTVPEITSITGLEESIVNNTELTISYTVFDAIGLKSIKVYVDGEVLEEITEFSTDFNNYQGSFTLEESEAKREIRIVVEDMAGNITDTDSEDFSSAYVFNSNVTITTNALVRFYANKPLFYGSIAGVVGVTALAGFGIHLRMKRREK